MNLDFSILAWAAFAPGLSSPEQWQAWAASPYLPIGDAPPAVPEMPALIRRRLGALGRTAVQAAYRAQADASSTCPVVWGSRYGEASRSVELLDELSKGQPLSPTSFGLSVHNAIGALFAIARHDRANQVSLAAGAATPEACLVEACGLLADGEPEVMVVCYEAPLPGDYAVFADEPGATWGWAWRIAAARPGDALRCRLSSAPCSPQDERENPSGHRATLPHGLDVLRHVLAGEGILRHACHGSAWSWGRHAQ